MARRVSIPDPVVISTELSALTENFEIQASDSLEQWYYVNNNTYLPDRSLYSLILTPVMRGFDPDTEIVHKMAFYLVRWYATEWDGTQYTESEILNTTDSDSADYVLNEDYSLTVKKNVNPNWPVKIRCFAEYIDPRESSTHGFVEGSVELGVNRDATEVFPTIQIDTPKQVTWNPLSDDSSQYTFHAVVTYQGDDVTSEREIGWFGYEIEQGSVANEQPMENLLAYVSGQGTPTLVVDAKYAEQLTIVAKARDNAQSPWYATTDYRTLSWKIPKMRATTICNNGSAVRASTKDMEFETIINVKGDVLTDDIKNKSLVMSWKRRIPTQTDAQAVSMGWGNKVIAHGETLMRENGNSILVYPYIYVLGALERVTFDGDTVTYNDVVCVERGK